MLSTPDDFDGIWNAFAGSRPSHAPLTESVAPGAPTPGPQGFSIQISKQDIVDFLQAAADEHQNQRVFDIHHAEELLETSEVYNEIAKLFKQDCVNAFYEIIKESVMHNPKLPSIYNADQDEQEKLRGVEDDHRDNENDQRRHARNNGIY